MKIIFALLTCAAGLTTHAMQVSAPPCVVVKSLNLCAQVHFVKPPVENQDSPFTLSFTSLAPEDNQRGHVLPNHKFTVDLFMPAMGHGSSPVTVTMDPQHSDFNVRDVYFVMKGDWNVRVRFVTENGIPLEMISIPVVVP